MVNGLGRNGVVARFDDLTSNGSGLSFSRPTSVLSTPTAGSAIDVLAQAEAASDSGSWVVGFVSYEAAAELAGLPVKAATSALEGPRVPAAWFAVFDEVTEVQPLADEPPRDFTSSIWRLAAGKGWYKRAFTSIRDRIAAGDTYQCNLTLPLHSTVRGDLLGFYRALALAQRGAYSAFIDTGDLVVASASPELFFEWSEGSVTTRPMKGTARRGRFSEEDQRQAAALRSSEKERAENLMIVDLLRNDLGRIAEFGSVEVAELFALERYEGLWQLTSTVRARPRPEVDLVELFTALFPSGSITGAPKHATMALIAGTEVAPRGLYCGAVGLLAPRGVPFRARFSVAIRTAVIDPHNGEAVYGAGGAITWGSRVLAEHDELLAKAAVLTAASAPFGLIETTAFEAGVGVRDEAAHLDRLESSAAYFGFFFDRSRIEQLLADELEEVDLSCRLRLLLERDGSLRVERAPLPEPPTGPVLLAVDTEPVDSSDRMLFHKTTCRAIYEECLARHPEADDVILVNERGEITETTIANLAVFDGGRWWTPPLEAGLLPGIGRARLIESGVLAERRLVVADLRRAEELALVSSLRGWRRAALVDQAPASSSDRTPVAAGSA